MKITIILTCYNRKKFTINCIKSLAEGSKDYDINFIVVDDNSTDGTREAIESLPYEIELLMGSGDSYWSGGMSLGIDHYLKDNNNSDYVLFVNDDVDFQVGIIEKMITRSKSFYDAIVVGATCDQSNKFTYGAIRKCRPRKKALYYHVLPSKEIIECDSFNCNCVLIKNEVIQFTGNFDPVYRHSLGDLDYGFGISSKGYKIISTEDYVGVCLKNTNNNTWLDISLSRWRRFKLKESTKGAPLKEWFYFMRKNFGLIPAIKYSVTPYIKILINR